MKDHYSRLPACPSPGIDSELLCGFKATQPCPCGYAGDRSGRCHCSADQIQRYRGKLSGPLLDGETVIGGAQLAEAIAYRGIDCGNPQG